MFSLSKKSLDKLKGVHEDLVLVVQDAIKITKIDFMVGEGLRSTERQLQLLKENKTKTMQSRHITGHAVDLWAYVSNEVKWDWHYYEQIANAMRLSAIKHNIPIVWGGCWDKLLNTIDDTSKADDDYVKRRKAKGNRAFLDGVHFELSKKKYPFGE